jgi:hypothetical protein
LRAVTGKDPREGTKPLVSFLDLGDLDPTLEKPGPPLDIPGIICSIRACVAADSAMLCRAILLASPLLVTDFNLLGSLVAYCTNYPLIAPTSTRSLIRLLKGSGLSLRRFM